MSSGAGPLLLAGGGHSHALLLKHWCMWPRQRPAGWIALVNRRPTALYSGLVPALIAGDAALEDCRIDLRRLCEQAQVSFIEAEITGLDPAERRLSLQGRPALAWERISLDVGAVSRPLAPQATGGGRAGSRPEATGDEVCLRLEGPLLPIKPLEPFLDWLMAEDTRLPTAAERRRAPLLTVVGSGLAGVEVALALRQRWPERRLALLARPGRPSGPLRRCLARAGVERVERWPADSAGPVIACTGSRAPAWLAESGLPVQADGRVLTDANLQVQGHPVILAAGDCAVVADRPRPPSGVWAVRAAPVLAWNLAALQGAGASRAGRGNRSKRSRLRCWRPQSRALQLLGAGGASRGLAAGGREALALWGPLQIGPQPLIWRWKQRLDRSFMEGFQRAGAMAAPSGDGEAAGSALAMACRGCAAKLPAASLRRALQGAGLDGPAEDAHAIGEGSPGWLQSVDGFPALLADPWRNARLTAWHACSDLWACGARVHSAQAVVTLPAVAPAVQEELLRQVLAGLRAALEPMGATLIGGHSLESRSEPPACPALGLEIALTVNGVPGPQGPWPKGGLQEGDGLILSRGLGSGVLLAAAMAGAVPPDALSAALQEMETSQAALPELMDGLTVHAATDITGFGLLGHLGEMLSAGAAQRSVRLEAAAIPALPGAIEQLAKGRASSLAPANREAWAWLEPGSGAPARVLLEGSGPNADTEAREQGEAGLGGPSPTTVLHELLVDPQTCGPLLLALPQHQVETALQRLQEAGFDQACRIGTVL
ncbi:selenide, water dikinase SelD [Synechococcus sp. RSCCF101]|uniref:selenide, water dikinase SelD n=1 Tax=Synechococcus sp. RSCCF101 TaxID=2511069 RepID=UPI0012464196|nr:selenide, water dikinase SelD [Synechococcus sp. RSCCF101]QEY32422.1 selenide, water dikinase SelD [Synechococcus sp. RSCCF101]